MLESKRSKQIMRFQNKIPDLYGQSNCEMKNEITFLVGSRQTRRKLQMNPFFWRGVEGRRLQLGASLVVAHNPSGVSAES